MSQRVEKKNRLYLFRLSATRPVSFHFSVGPTSATRPSTSNGKTWYQRWNGHHARKTKVRGLATGRHFSSNDAMKYCCCCYHIVFGNTSGTGALLTGRRRGVMSLERAQWWLRALITKESSEHETLNTRGTLTPDDSVRRAIRT